MSDELKEVWIVIDECGQPSFCASWPEACHEHINDAVMGDFPNAARWVVRKAVIGSDLAAPAAPAAPAVQPDADPNAPWLTLAHAICTDAGVAHGFITDRLEQLRERIAPAVQNPVAWMNPKDTWDVRCADFQKYDLEHGGVSRKNAEARTVPLYAVPVPVVPPGYALVPIEPTPEMLKAGSEVRIESENSEYGFGTSTANNLLRAELTHAAMLAAAPQSQVPTYHCNICGGQVDLNNATKPTADFSTAGRAGREQPPVLQTATLRPMESENGRKGYYIDTPELYCDIEPDEHGVWSVYFRDRKTDNEAFAEKPPVPQDVLEEAKSTILWLKRRLAPGYDELPHMQRTLAAIDKAIAAAPVPQDDKTTTPMCERKTNDIMQRDGYHKTGYVLMKDDPSAHICVSDQGAISWFTPDQWHWLMHNRDHVGFEWPKPIGAQIAAQEQEAKK